MDQSIFPIVGIDIGGTMSKITFAARPGTEVKVNHIQSLKIQVQDKFEVYFAHVPSRDISSLIQLIKQLGMKKLHITGGGAYKYQDEIKAHLDVEVVKLDEFESLRRGFDFLDQLTPNHSFYMHSIKEGNLFIKRNKSIYPFLLVNIGSGVSILKFDETDKFTRVGGTSLGGGMFLGLCNALTGIKDYDKLLALSKEGNSQELQENQSQANLVKSLLYLTAYNLSQLAFLQSKKHNIERVFFSGYFIRGHIDTIQCITNSFNKFSSSEGTDTQAYFVKHDGFVGSLGALQQALQESALDLYS